MGNKNDLSSRMKEYEACYNIKFPARTYVIVRLDGKGFSKYTKMFDKPFDDHLSNVMDVATIELCKYLNPKFAYTQSDEISLLFTDIENIESELIFDGKLQKLCSISASKVTSAFNYKMLQILSGFKYQPDELITKILTGDLPEIEAVFDSRVFIIPDFREVSNYFIWRQQDCTRNSLSMAASAAYSHHDLENKSGSDKHDMLMAKGINWNDYKSKYKRGAIIKKHTYDIDGVNGETVTRSKWIPVETPIFTEDKEFLYNLIPTIKI